MQGKKIIRHLMLFLGFILLTGSTAWILKADAAIDTRGINHIRNAVMTASSVEAETSFTPSKANDGDAGTRWASNYDPTMEQWLKAEFQQLTSIRHIKISFHGRG